MGQKKKKSSPLTVSLDSSLWTCLCVGQPKAWNQHADLKTEGKNPTAGS